MGQGTFQSVPALIAEEFEVSLDQVIIKQTNGEKEFGNTKEQVAVLPLEPVIHDLRKIGASAKAGFYTGSR